MKKLFFALPLVLLSVETQAQSENEFYKFSDEITQNLEKDATNWKYQMGATYFSISGYYQKALETWDKNGTQKKIITAQDSLFFSESEKLNARDYIVNRSKSEQIIIINEAHTNARHRTFTKSLLQGLYDNGYRYLGLEALLESGINERKFPITESGYYTNEPEFGNLLYEALKIGFTLFSYEATNGKNNKEREIEQAQNIKQFMDSHPKGKVLIHCGHAHVYENDYKPWGKAMAGRVKEYTGIDPFTINQEIFTEKGSPELSHPFVNLTTEKHSIVLKSKSGELFNGFSEPKQTDIVVIHPQTQYINGRPDWLAAERIPYTISKKKIKKMPILVFAYRNTEYDKNGIPADILEITENKENKTLYLSSGSYEIIVKDRNYKSIDRYKIKVK